MWRQQCFGITIFPSRYLQVLQTGKKKKKNQHRGNVGCDWCAVIPMCCRAGADCDFCVQRDCLLKRKCEIFFFFWCVYPSWVLDYMALHTHKSLIPLGMSTRGEVMWICRALRCPGSCGVVGLQSSRSISFFQHDAEVACSHFRNITPNNRSSWVARHLSQTVWKICPLSFRQ